MHYAKVTKRGGRKPVIARGALNFGAANFVGGCWQAVKLSIAETECETELSLTVELGRKLAVDTAAYLARTISATYVDVYGTDDKRTQAQCLRDLADLLEQG
jgi:hypothetical protein